MFKKHNQIDNNSRHSQFYFTFEMAVLCMAFIRILSVQFVILYLEAAVFGMTIF